MAKYAVTPSGVDALNKCATSLTQGLESVEKANAGLATLASENKEGLGPHADEVEEILKDINTFTTNAKGPVNSMSTKLTSLAKKYEDIISKKLKK